MYVIGTAGHVDHGKSTLVQALTGIHPDRLKEEREREMTIDLGFAWLTLPNGEELGIVDVPGHRDFIENMLSGIGGIDAALFVVAADEGVMPQTREHLAILDLLQIQGGVVALTKIDLVDQDWVDLVQEDLRQVLIGTVLESAAIVPVSARTRQGIPELLAAIHACLAGHPPRPDLNRPRLPIDRIFTIVGFGTVVTGTLSDGRLKIGDELEVLPQGLKGRVRGLQTHKHKEDTALPGSRTAVNIAGVPLELIHRGDVLTHPGDYLPTRRMDVRFRLLAEASQSLKHNTEVKLFIGSMEVVARARLLGGDELLPGEVGWLQLELTSPVVAIRGDHYILRRPSPGETTGGGLVIDPHPRGRHKRFSKEVLANLESLSHGAPTDVLLQSVFALGAALLKEVIARSNLNSTVAQQAALELFNQGLLFPLESHPNNSQSESSDRMNGNFPGPNEMVTSKSLWEQISSNTVHEVQNYHTLFPLRPGIPREELKSRSRGITNLSPKLFNLMLSKLVDLKQLEENGPLVCIPDFQIKFSPQQEHKMKRLLERFSHTPYSPPTVKECQEEVGEDLFQALLDTGKLIAVNPDIVFRKEDYQQMVSEIRQMIHKNGPITAAQVRDHFNTSRKYSLALLEYMDSAGITVREGDFRRLQ
jgi:selenocysteine-specific elongation factor